MARLDDEDEEQTTDDAGDDQVDDGAASAQEDDAAPVAPGADPAAPVDKDQAIKDYLAKQYGQAGDSSGVQAAMERANRMNTIANIGDALETVARARSTALGGPGADSSFYQGIKQQGTAGVQQAEAARQAKIKGFVEQQQLQRQAVADTQKAAEFAQAQKLGQLKLDAADPASRTSKIARAAFNANFPEVAQAMGKDFENLSTEDLGRIGQITDTKAKIDAAKEAAKARAATSAIARQQHVDQQNITRNVAFSKGFAADENKFADAQGKIDETMNMVDQATRGGVASQLVPLEVARGIAGRLNPQEIAAAGGDPSTVAKLQRLFDKAASGQMTVQDATQYRELLQSQKDTLDATRSQQRETSIQTYAHASGQPVDLVRGLTNVDQPRRTAAAPKPGAPAGGAGTATAAPALRPGHQEGGYEFQGGDPGDPKSWKKIGSKD